MIITAFFTNNGIPATGLSPTIRIRDLFDNSLVITDAAMSEVGDGGYKYNYISYDATKEYSIRCDGGVLLSATERYTYGGNENYYEDTQQSVWSETVSGYSNADTFGGLVRQIDTNTESISASFINISNDLKRVLGLMHENIYIDNPVYDSDCNLTSARIRIYSNAGSVGTSNDVIGTYEISAPASGPGKFVTWKQIKV